MNGERKGENLWSKAEKGLANSTLGGGGKGDYAGKKKRMEKVIKRKRSFVFPR